MGNLTTGGPTASDHIGPPLLVGGNARSRKSPERLTRVRPVAGGWSPVSLARWHLGPVHLLGPQPSGWHFRLLVGLVVGFRI